MAEVISIWFAMVGSAIASYGSFIFLVKQGAISQAIAILHNSGKTKIKDVVYSACQVFTGFILITISYIIQLATKINIELFFYIILFPCVFFFCIYTLFFMPKRIICREEKELEKKIGDR